MKLDWNPVTKRIIGSMSKKEAWALRELLARLETRGSCVKKEYLRAFNAMINKDARNR